MFIFFHGRTIGVYSNLLKMLKERFRRLNVSFPTFQNHLGILPLMLLLERSKNRNSFWYFRKSGNSSKLQEDNHKNENLGTVELIFDIETHTLLPERSRMRSSLSSNKMFNSTLPLRLMEERGCFELSVKMSTGWLDLRRLMLTPILYIYIYIYIVSGHNYRKMDLKRIYIQVNFCKIQFLSFFIFIFCCHLSARRNILEKLSNRILGWLYDLLVLNTD